MSIRLLERDATPALLDRGVDSRPELAKRRRGDRAQGRRPARPTAPRTHAAGRAHVPVLADELLGLHRPPARTDGHRLHLRRRRPRPPRRRAPRPVRDADRDRPRPSGRTAIRRAGRRGGLLGAVHPLRLRGGARGARRRGASCGHRLLRPGHVLDAGGHPRPRLLLFVRGAAGHAHGPHPAADREGDRGGVGRAPPRRDAARARRGAPRRCDRARDRETARAGPDRDHSAARRGDQLRDSLRRRGSAAATPPSAPSRRCASPSTTSSASSTAPCPWPGGC